MPLENKFQNRTYTGVWNYAFYMLFRCTMQMATSRDSYIVCMYIYIPTAYFQLENGLLPPQRISGQILCLALVCPNNSYAD